MDNESKRELCQIRVFDFFNLFNKDKLERWLVKHSTEIETKVYEFGNLNIYTNREQLFNSLYGQLDLTLDEDYDKSIIENAIVEYAERFINGKDSIKVLGKNISNFSVYIELFEKVNSDISEHFWELHELSDLRFDEIGNWEPQVKRLCKSIIQTKSDDT